LTRSYNPWTPYTPHRIRRQLLTTASGTNNIDRGIVTTHGDI
jgi:hypothetical protein